MRGVSSSKTDVHKAIAKLDKGLYPGAFCKILPDYLGLPPDPRVCNVLHADTAGTKAGLAYMVWKKTGSIEAASNVAIDALVMNTDDVGCVGATGHLLVNQTIGRNSYLIPQEVIQAIINEAQAFCDMLSNHCIPCHFAGGETASVGDIVRTLDVGSSVAARMLRKDVIDASRIANGDYIVGFSSTGRAVWEDCDNTGIGANGLTNARHDCFCDEYRGDSELYAPQMPKELVFRGPYQVTDDFPGDSSFTVGGALLSPTRTYLPLIKKVLDAVGRKHIHAIIHCSGGGQTKIGKFGNAKRYIKVNPFPIPPVFEMIQKVSGLSWYEMYQTFNMGHRLEMVVNDKAVAQEVMHISRQECRIESRMVGHVLDRVSPGLGNTVEIEMPSGGRLMYEV